MSSKVATLGTWWVRDPKDFSVPPRSPPCHVKIADEVVFISAFPEALMYKKIEIYTPSLLINLSAAILSSVQGAADCGRRRPLVGNPCRNEDQV